jgi:signal transduction histidine kinase
MALALLQASPDKASEATSQEINRNIHELDSLIEEILLASRLDAPDAIIGQTESFDLMGLAAEECARTSAELMVDDNSQGSFEMMGYPRLVRRLLRNLLENANRYNNPDKGAVTLALTAQGDSFNIVVRDHGPGVAENECTRIFEPFYRAKNASERDGGVGLGLALVKSIAQRHGGSATCLPMLGMGGCFVATLSAA